MQETALLGIVLFPLISAIVCGLLGRDGGGNDWVLSRKAVHVLACASVGASFLLALYCFIRLFGMHEGPDGPNPALSYHAYEWFSLVLGSRIVPINLRFTMDALSSVMTLIVTGIGFLIHVYSTGYMSEEKSYGRFFCYLNLFTASMLILVLGSNLPLLFVGWEGVGLCSYLLIGFWYENPAYAAAGRKAFVANRIGDFGVLIGMFLLLAAAGSFELDVINSKAELMTAPIRLPGLTLPGITVATAATLCLFLGCTGKSAQIPLFVWLPDAMAGPTPVSALIHAATMVTSGLYLICRLSPVFALAPTTMAIIAVVGALTALLAATIGCVQNEIKKVLAYSTVSQLGFMFAAAGCGAFAASFFHVYTHAFFKACLFLGAGSVMHAVGAHGDADIRVLGGLKKYMPRTRWTFLASCLAIAGVPGLSGFFSKDEILVGALSVGDYFASPGLGIGIFALLVLAATMTAFYMFRLYFLTFEGEYRGGPEHDHEAHASHAAHAAPEAEHEGDAAHAGDHHGGHAPHESPASMTIPLIVLGIGAAIGGYVWIGLVHFQPWVDWLAPALGDIGTEHQGAYVALGAGFAAAVVGIGLAYLWYGRPGVETPAKLAAALPGLHRFLLDKWRVDELYDATLLRGSRLLGLASAGFDKVAVDGLLTKVSAELVRALGYLAARMQTGLVHLYGAVMVLGVVFVLLWFMLPHVSIEAPEPPSGSDVTLRAALGLGYEYRWDFDSDGEPDTDWNPSAEAAHTYTDEEMQPGVVVVVEPAIYGAGLAHYALEPGDWLDLRASELGQAWQSDPDDARLPRFEVTESGVVVHPGGARVRSGGSEVSAESKLVLSRGEVADVGQARVTVTGEARATVWVRNAFGVERKGSASVLLPQVVERPSVEVLSLRGAR